jgi:predicted nucleic acid-binding protein
LIIVDTNIVVSAVLGKHVQLLVQRMWETAEELAIPAPQLSEACEVLTKKLGIAPEGAKAAVADVCEALRRLNPPDYHVVEEQARARLHERAQSDWPVLAAAIALDAAIWSNDRDFFGVGIPVWSTRNILFAVQR